MMAVQNVTERLKAEKPTAFWIGRMNNIRACADAIFAKTHLSRIDGVCAFAAWAILVIRFRLYMNQRYVAREALNFSML